MASVPIRRRLLEMGVLPGTELTIERVAPLCDRSKCGCADTACRCAGARPRTSWSILFARPRRYSGPLPINFDVRKQKDGLPPPSRLALLGIQIPEKPPYLTA
jgi:hypothetical protein